MLKRTPKKVKRPVEKPVDLPSYMQGYTGPLGSEGIEFSDTAFWIDDSLRIDEDWLNAFKAADEKGDKCDKRPLTTLLRSGRKLVPAVRDFLADLIERKLVPLPKGPSRIPAYDLSDIEKQLLLAVMSAHDYVERCGDSVQDALVKAAKEYPEISVDTLAAAYAGQRTLARRIADRRRPSKRRGALK